MSGTTVAGTRPARSPAELARLAYTDGLAAGLRAVLDPARPVPATARGYTLLPAGYPADGTALPHPLAALEGLVYLRLAAPGGAGPGYAPPLAAVRLGLLHRMLDMAVEHLAARRSGGAPLTTRQLVQASIADLATTLETARHALTGNPAAAGWLHARFDAADLAVASLFGAAGYLRAHPVRCLHLAGLVRAAWAPGGGGE